MKKIYTKKTISIMLALVLILGINISVQAEETKATKVYIASAVVEEGQVFSVPITITKPEEYIAAFDLWLTYDTSKVEVLDIVPGIVPISHNIDNSGEIRTAYVDFEKGLGFKEEGTLFTIRMKAKSRVEGNFLLRSVVYDFYNSQGSSYESIEVEPGKIQIQSLSYNDDFDVNIPKEESKYIKFEIMKEESSHENKFTLKLLSKDLDVKEKVKVTISLTSKEISKFGDVRKVGVYKVNADGTLEYKGGWIKGNELTFLTEESGTYVLKENIVTFKDISSHWAKEYIEVLASRHIAQGTDSENFNPSSVVTRGQFATFLGRTLGLDNNKLNQTILKDVNKDAYYAPYINQLYNMGIIQGYNDGTFRPDGKISREEMITLIMRLDSYVTGEDLSKVASKGNAQFTDAGKVGNWAKDSVIAAYNLGIIEGRPDGSFGPSESAQRGDISKLIVKLLERIHD